MRGSLRKGEGRRAPKLTARVPSMLLLSLCLVWCAQVASMNVEEVTRLFCPLFVCTREREREINTPFTAISPAPLLPTPQIAIKPFKI